MTADAANRHVVPQMASRVPLLRSVSRIGVNGPHMDDYIERRCGDAIGRTQQEAAAHRKRDDCS